LVQIIRWCPTRIVESLAAGMIFVFVWLGAPTWAVVAAEPTAQELAQALQRKYDGIRDFSTDFVHKYRGGVLKKELTERGHLLVKKPGKMRWEYKAPEQKLFVSDGVKAYSYIPQDRQVIVSSIPPGDELGAATLFLTGKGNLLRDFTPSLVPPQAGATPGTRALKLVPKSPQRDYDWLIIETAADSLALRGLVTVDAQGGESTFSFANLKENTGLADKEFAFTIPRGVDVVSDSPSR
jgi:outer membrane lipoprotein carrier protein